MNNISFVHGVMKICPWYYEDMGFIKRINDIIEVNYIIVE
jgi:hypothetical protein